MAKAKSVEANPLEDKMQALAGTVSTFAESISTINERLSDLEPKIARILPREGPVPMEIWLSLDKDVIVSNALKGCIEGILANAPLHNMDNPHMQETYATIALNMAEVFLAEIAKRRNELVTEKPNEDDS
jgi:hypothetical protein